MSEIQQDSKIYFKESLNKAITLSEKEAEESLPFLYKYESRQILQDLIQIIQKDNYEYKYYAVFLVKYLLGLNFMECEENTESEQYFKDAYEIFQLLKENKLKLSSFYIEILNTLAFLLINRDDNNEGLLYLEQSDRYYQQCLEDLKNEELLEQQFIESIYPFKKDFNISQSIEKNYTLTLFYKAQLCTKLDQKEKGAYYCGLTMQRQLKFNEYQIKDFCINCVSLSDYYCSLSNFAQAYYLIMAGLQLIPENRKKKLRATLQMSFGRNISEFLKLLCHKQEKDNMNEIINKQFLVFEEIDIKFPHLTVDQSKENIQSVFRQANTKLKQAQEYFVLDGYVTEHISILKDQQELYKYLSFLESNHSKIVAYHQKRIQILQPILDQINPKAYQQIFFDIQQELALTYSTIFETRFNEMFDSGKQLKPLKILEMNENGIKCIELYKDIGDSLQKEKQNSEEHYQSVLNTLFNIAKIYSRLQPLSKEEKIEVLKNSLLYYRKILEYITIEVSQELKTKFAEQFKICQDMVELIPKKIDKFVNEIS